MKKIPNSVGDWNPSTPSGSYDKLLEPGARETPDVVSGTNKQENFVGKKMGVPSDSTLGKKGREC